MALRRVQRKTERTPEQMTELRAVRESFQREQPGQDELAASGDYDGPFRQGDIMTLLSALATLKRERERQGLSLAEVLGPVGARQGDDQPAGERQDPEPHGQHPLEVCQRRGDDSEHVG